VTEIVLDASAAVDYLMGLVSGDDLLDHDAVVPDVYVTEVANAFARTVKRGVLDDDTARTRLDAALTIPTSIVPGLDLLEGAWPLATRFLSFPDAAYVALAVAGDRELWTTDGRLATADQIPGGVVRLLPTEDRLV
jgi:predicted nucleic acid-binding protein